MLRIGQFSKLARVSIKALRYYDRIGLLKPAMIDTSTSYRYYTRISLRTSISYRHTRVRGSPTRAF